MLGGTLPPPQKKIINSPAVFFINDPDDVFITDRKLEGMSLFSEV